jgi:hypothetical protein
MDMHLHSIAWFDIPVTDFERARKFYSHIFSFEMTTVPMGTLTMGIFLHDQAKGIGGAIVLSDDRKPSADGSVVYLFAGEDLKVVENRIPEAGGTVLLPKTEIAPGMGYFALFFDTEGNKVGLHSMN